MIDPTLILLPGLQGGALFEPLKRHIPAHVPTRTFEYPTHTRSTHTSMLAHMENQLANTDNLILLGESFSGPLALQFACKHPARVRAVILVCSFIGPPVPRLLCYLAQPFILTRFPILYFMLRLFIAGMRAPYAIARDLHRTIRANRPHVLAHRVHRAAWINAARDLKDCPVPLFALAAAQDRLVCRRAIRRIRRVRPDIHTAEIEGPHLLLQTRPQQSWHAISQFLASLSHPGAGTPKLT